MRTVAGCAIGFTLAAICGCGSLPLNGGFLGRKPGKDAARDVADRESNPFRKSAGGASNRDERDESPLGPRSTSPAVASGNDDARRLQTEIADLSADKQRAILREWKQIDPAMRPHYLRVIRNQRLLRQSNAESNGRRRLTPDEYESQAGNRDRDRLPAFPANGAGTADSPGNDAPVGRSHRRRRSGGSGSDIADGSRSSGPGHADSDVPDRFQPRDAADGPGRNRPSDRNADRRDSRDSRNPLRNSAFHRADDNPRGGDVKLTSAGRIATTEAEPFSPEWNRTLQRLVELSAAETAKDKTPNRKDELSYLRRQVYLRMLYLLSGKTTQAVQAIPHVEAADQEFWQKTMWGISAYLDDRGESDRRSRATQTITRFNEAIEHLRAEADLTVRNVLFCKKIDSFGSYDKVVKTEFRPGEQVLVYAEIENFKTELTAQSHHRTRLKSEIELFQKVGSEYRESKRKFDFPPTEDVCRSYRRDYFHSYILTLPQSLGLGDYVLKLTVTDQVGNKIGSDTVQFTVK